MAAQLVLTGLLLSPAVFDRFGAQEVTLNTAPVDPRDLLRGQYLTLGYGVSQVQAEADLASGQPAYVLLRQGEGGIWTGDRATAVPPTSGVFLKGKVQWVASGKAALNYGIERFYFSEKIMDSQAISGAARLQARVSVAPSGRARLLQLWQGGVRIH